jgi:D-arabinose 1-dehydrogenase-like Zn-dependent alcohol dehydrogenase
MTSGRRLTVSCVRKCLRYSVSLVSTGGQNACNDVSRARTGPRRIKTDSVNRAPHHAIVRVSCAAICGSDLHLYHGMMPDLRVGHTFRP